MAGLVGMRRVATGRSNPAPSTANVGIGLHGPLERAPRYGAVDRSGLDHVALDQAINEARSAAVCGVSFIFHDTLPLGLSKQGVLRGFHGVNGWTSGALGFTRACIIPGGPERALTIRRQAAPFAVDRAVEGPRSGLISRSDRACQRGPFRGEPADAERKSAGQAG